MLVALIANKPGLARTAALALLSLSALFGVGLFGGQMAAPEKFGCAFFGEDFVTLYASAKLMLAGEGAKVYDLRYLAETRARVLREAGSICDSGSAVAMAYGLVFMAPLLPLTVFPARLAYYAWTGLTMVLFFSCGWRLARVAGVSPWPFWLITLGFFPVVHGLLEGQVHGLQFVALVEFWLALRRRADRSAGLWLSLQLVKPQFLPLLVLWALWQRRWRPLGWFAGAGLLWLSLMVWLAGGMEGIGNYVRMMREVVVAPDAPISVSGMANWRAVAVVWLGAGGYQLVGAATLLLSLATVAWVLFLWRKRGDEFAALTPLGFITVMAGTLLAAYDTHIYSGVLLLAPLLLVLVNIGRTSWSAGFWAALLDFTLLAPSLAAIPFIPFATRPIVLPMVSVVLPWFLVAQALIVAAVAILAASLFAPIHNTEHVPLRVVT